MLDSFKSLCWSSSSCLKNSLKIIIITTAILSILFQMFRRDGEKTKTKKKRENKRAVNGRAEDALDQIFQR